MRERVHASGPFLTVIVPVYNGGALLERCLTALRASDSSDFELLVVDDGSTDDSAALARRFGATVLATPFRSGPGAARNLGSMRAHGEFVCFIDADCAVHPDTIGRLTGVLRAHPELDAVFGSYDRHPAAPGFIAQYKNLFHHYIHQNSSERATTFWAGCGAVRRTTFLAAGGFDASRFRRPSIEDIELGARLASDGKRILLAKEVQVTHLKAWNLFSLIKVDVFDRAIPWTRLMLARRDVVSDLNLRAQHRASGVLAWLLLFCLAAAPFSIQAAAASGAAAAILLGLNLDLYLFLARERDPGFAARAIPLHWLYYLYATAGFFLGAILSVLDVMRPVQAPAPLAPR